MYCSLFYESLDFFLKILFGNKVHIIEKDIFSFRMIQCHIAQICKRKELLKENRNMTVMSYIPQLCHTYPSYVIHTPAVSYIPQLCHTYPGYVIHTPSMSYMPQLCHFRAPFLCSVPCPWFHVSVGTHTPAMSYIPQLCHTYPIYVIHTSVMSYIPQLCNTYPSSKDNVYINGRIFQPVIYSL